MKDAVEVIAKCTAENKSAFVGVFLAAFAPRRDHHARAHCGGSKRRRGRYRLSSAKAAYNRAVFFANPR